MKFDELQSYNEVVEYLNKKKRVKHLLFGNGFSMAYDYTIFSYNALSSFIQNIDDDILKQLFSRLNTKNFELIMQQLDNFIEIADIFTTDSEMTERIKSASEKLQNSLIDAIKSLHPEHVFTIPEEKGKVCTEFLQDYLSNNGCIFSTNYDLLPYWVLMRNDVKNAVDGFGRDLETDLEKSRFVSKDELEYSELRWGRHKDNQNIFYLHGSLPLFDTGIHIVKEEYDNGHYLLENIKARMDKKEYPIFVTAGDAKDKLNHITHNKYLNFCYDKLCQIEGSLIVFGFNFGEYDTHIIDAINKAAHQGKRGGNKLHSVYIGVYSEDDLKHIESIENRFKYKINKYNARTAKIWD
ncbi:MAG: DUF4917 family protein [Tannerellaceae bacterium]|nr:DUF4917 family protein [Tannerellaceae bacterium]